MKVGDRVASMFGEVVIDGPLTEQHTQDSPGLMVWMPHDMSHFEARTLIRCVLLDVLPPVVSDEEAP